MYDVVTDFGVQLSVAIISGLVLLALGYAFSRRKKKLRAPHNIRTSAFGLQFIQDEKRAPVIHQKDHDEVILSAEPFEIRVDKKLFPLNANQRALCVGSFMTDRIWKKARTSPPPTGYFSAGLAKIDREFGSGFISLSEFTRGDPGEPSDLFSYQYFDEERFQSDTGDQFLLYVSAITTRAIAYFEMQGNIAVAEINDARHNNLIRRGAMIFLIIAVKYRSETEKVLVPKFDRILLKFK